MENKTLSLYIHIPFCESKCYYCNFVSNIAKNEDKQKYINYLLKEIELYKNKKTYLKTIFIGGGTPSCLVVGEITKILNKVKDCFIIDDKTEITIECNPNSFSLEKAKEYKSCGINRLSFGLQSANDKLLKEINRIHTKKDFINAVKIAKQTQFDNINADILLGLPNQRLRDVKSTLKLLIKLKIKHISCYSLILEEHTKLYSLVKNNTLKLPEEDKTIKMYDFCLKYLKKHKLYRYEVSNFAKLNYECKHNLVYWNLDDYLGVGLNSHSKIDNIRYENFADYNSYYNYLDKNKKPIKNRQELSLSEIKEEFIMLGLRKQQGINLGTYKLLFNQDLLSIKQKEIKILLNYKFINIKNNYLFATDQGFKVLNQIILYLI